MLCVDNDKHHHVTSTDVMTGRMARVGGDLQLAPASTALEKRRAYCSLVSVLGSVQHETANKLANKRYVPRERQTREKEMNKEKKATDTFLAAPLNAR